MKLNTDWTIAVSIVLYWFISISTHIITAKLEDKEDQLPSIEQMQHLARLGNPEHYTVDEFQKMELYLLRFFNWSVSHPTPAHYADYFLTHGNALDSENPSTSPAATMDPVTRRIQMEKYNTYFIEAALRGELATLHTVNPCSMIYRP